MTTPRSGLSLADGMDLSDQTFHQLWVAQVGVGGEIGPIELEAIVLGLLAPTAYEHNVIAQAINEHFIERGENHPVAYDASGVETDSG